MTVEFFDKSATTEPGDPFFTGTGPITNIDYSLPCSVDGKGFLIDRLGIYGKHRRSSIDLINTQSSAGGSDLTPVVPEVWRRIAESWHYGAGQERFDREDSIPFRFTDSHNIDVWKRWQMCLLNGTEQIHSLAAGKAFITTVGPSRFVVVVGSQSYWWTSLDLPVTAFTLPANVLDVTSDGANLYTLNASGQITRYSGPSAGTVIGTVPNFDAARPMLVYTKGFILASGSQSLYDMTTGTALLVYQHPLETFTWRDAADGLAAAYVLGGVGDKWAVYGMTINDNATSFNPPVQAAPIPEGEIGYALASYLGYILIGTSEGWRFGVPAGDGTLTFGKLVETDAPVRAFEGQDRFVWYGKSSSPAKLGRADLSQFVAPMTPAYASDLETAVNGSVDGVITFNNKRVFVVSGQGVYAETDELAEEGWLEQGGMSFNSADPKVGMYLLASHAPIVDGKVAVDIKYDNGGYAEIGSNEVEASITMGNMPLGPQFHVAYIRYRIERGDTTPTASPCLNRAEIRALNVPGRATLFMIPLILREDLYHDDATVLRDPAEDYQFLFDLWMSRRRFTYREAGQTFDLNATGFDWIPEQISQDGSAYQGVFLLTAKEIR